MCVCVCGGGNDLGRRACVGVGRRRISTQGGIALFFCLVHTFTSHVQEKNAPHILPLCSAAKMSLKQE